MRSRSIVPKIHVLNFKFVESQQRVETLIRLASLIALQPRQWPSRGETVCVQMFFLTLVKTELRRPRFVGRVSIVFTTFLVAAYRPIIPTFSEPGARTGKFASHSECLDLNFGSTGGG